MKNKAWLWGLGLAAVLVIGAAGIWVLTQSYTFHGSVIDPAMRAPDFTLTAHTGKPFRLADQAGEIVVLFFGYTSCPDVCPTTLATFKRTKTLLARETGRVQFIFITVDPERDTVDRVRNWVTAFDSSFIGLTGTEAELTPVWKAYGVYREKMPAESGSTGYSMDHSTAVYVIDARGNLRLTFSYGETAEAMAQDIGYLLNEKTP